MFSHFSAHITLLCKSMIYFAFICPYLTYCLTIWSSTANVHVRKILVLQKRAILLILSVHFCEQMLPLAHKDFFLLLPELYKYCLCLFMQHLLKYYPHVLNYNNFVCRSGSTHSASNNNLFNPHASTSMRRNTILFNSVLG